MLGETDREAWLPQPCSGFEKFGTVPEDEELQDLWEDIWEDL